MKILSCFIEGEPAPQPRARVSMRGGFARAYTPQGKVQPWRKAIAASVAGKAPASPVREPVSVWLGFYLSRPKSHHKRSGALTGQAPLRPIGPRADVDNLAKAVLDELTGVLWEDDGQVVGLFVVKQYASPGQPAGVDISVATVS